MDIKNQINKKISKSKFNNPKRRKTNLLLDKQSQSLKSEEFSSDKNIQVQFSTIFKGKKITIEEQNHNIVQGHKGYLSIMSNFPVLEGLYFFEVKILEPKLPLPFKQIIPSVRIGVSSEKFNSELVLGCDKNSYSIRGNDGKICHKSELKDYSEKFDINDTIGVLLSMRPPQLMKIESFNKKDQNMLNQENNKIQYVEQNIGSWLQFFKNGKALGIAYENLNQAYYYAGVSLYMNARAQINFGPQFEFQPQLVNNNMNIKSFSEIANEELIYKDVKIY